MSGPIPVAEQTQAERKQKEARRVAWIWRGIGVTSVGLTGALSAVAAAEGPSTLLFQPAGSTRVANYETAPPSVTELVVEVPVPSPLPPTHVPASAGAAGSGWQASGAAPPPSVIRAGVGLPPAPVPAPTATSKGSVPH